MAAGVSSSMLTPLLLAGVVLGYDMSWPLEGTFIVASDLSSSVKSSKVNLTITSNPSPTSFTITGTWIGGPSSSRAAFTGMAQNSGVKWKVLGGVSTGTNCPTMPLGDVCGWTIGCPILAGHQYPSYCLAPNAHFGCGTTRSLQTGIPQCSWSTVELAQAQCGQWDECFGFTCAKSTTHDPPGCGCSESFCKCTPVFNCAARGNGTHVSGGESGDTVDYAYTKIGTASGTMHFSDGPPNEIANATATGSAPTGKDFPFTFDFATGKLAWTTSGSGSAQAAWQHVSNYVAPMPKCVDIGCTKMDPGKRCNCDTGCFLRQDCCADYNAICLPPTPGTKCTGSALSANLPIAECDALQAFYDATDGANWKNYAKTFRNDPCGCDHADACGGGGGGVCCQAGHVTQIYLGNSGLGGKLPTGGLKALSRLVWLDLACNSMTGIIPSDFLDWPRWPGDDPRDEKCQLSDNCGNKWTCPVPTEAAARCLAVCIYPPVPVPTTCIRAAFNATVLTSNWISFDRSGLEAKMVIAQPAGACSLVLTGGTASGQGAYWSPSRGTIDMEGDTTMTLMPIEAPMKGKVSTTAQGTRVIVWANGVTWSDCASPHAPDCSM